MFILVLWHRRFYENPKETIFMKITVNLKTTLLALSFALAVCLVSIPVAMAQEEGAEETEMAADEDVIELEEVVVVGTRAAPRSVLESAVPIDIVSNEDFQKQGSTDLPNLLRTLVPSYNVNTQPISDAGTVVRPANLRGLAPDHTLVLVNNKRRHRAAVIHWLGNGLADGAQGPDLSPIPAIALKQVEVLRDGASAQYGSDAIAGVMNFQLRDNFEGGSLEFKPGIYGYGDGRQFSIAGNIGLGTPETWVNLSIERGGADPTIRSVQRNDAKALEMAGNTNVRNPAQIWGLPIVEDDLKFFANYGSTLSDAIDFYGHANYASKRVEGGFYFRNPNTRSAVFSGDSGKTLLVGNLSGLEEGVDSSADDIPIVDHVPDAEMLTAVKNDPNLFTFQEMFPGGFTPRFGAFMEDSSVLVGVKGEAFEESLGEALSWDLSAYFGRNHADFFIFNTVNASLGPDTPTDFDPGDYIQTDYNLNLDVTYPLHELVFLASGLEYRNEGFEIVEGQRESYQIGPLASQGFSAASNGFSGFSPIAAGVWTRYNVAAYVESEIRPIDNWLLALAVRGEDFEDFGSTVNFKVATNYGITENMKFRGSYSSGFRAPTPGQQNAFNVTTEFNFLKNDLVNNGTIPSTNPAVAVVTGKEDNALDPEKSNNFTGGFTAKMVDVDFTVDFFDIRMKDRLALSQDFGLTDQQKEDLIKEGVTSAANLQEFRFFTNDFDTTTQGIDIVITAPIPSLTGTVSGVYNYTRTTVTNNDQRVKWIEELEAHGIAEEGLADNARIKAINDKAAADRTAEETEILTLKGLVDNVDHRIKELEENLPQHRASLTVLQPLNEKIGALGRLNYFSNWYDSEDNATYTAKFTVDLELTYTADSGIAITVGANNVLNQYPDENPAYSEDTSAMKGDNYNPPDIGNKYGQFSPFGFDGAFWYAKVGYSF